MMMIAKMAIAILVRDLAHDQGRDLAPDLGTISHKKFTHNNFWSQAQNQKFHQKI